MKELTGEKNTVAARWIVDRLRINFPAVPNADLVVYLNVAVKLLTPSPKKRVTP